MRKNTINDFKLLPIFAAILLTCGNSYAAENSEVQDLITPSSSVSIGVGSVNNALDAKRFSQYTGLNQSASLLLDFDINKREDATGFWTKFSGRNLGLDTRELSFSQSVQGDWKYALDYNEIVRRDPYIIHTGMTGVGTTAPVINLIANPVLPVTAGTWGGTRATGATANATTTNLSTALSPNGFLPSNGIAGHDVELKIKRTAIGISGEKWFTPELQFELSFKTEDKKGARMFGRVGINSADMKLNPASAANATKTVAATLPSLAGGGIVNPNGGWALLLTPEPINSNTKQLEAKLNFNRDSLALTAGYYGSFYTNSNGSMSPVVPGTLNRGALWTSCAGVATSATTGAVTGGAGCSTVQQLASSAVALPPDNQAHQLYLTGNYAFSDTTRSNFKLAYTHATQNQSYAAMGLGLGPMGQTSLNGVVDTTLAQFGLAMKPIKDLSVNASFRYEDRADKTPLSVYNLNGIAGNVLNGATNWGSGSQTRTTAKLDGVYRLAAGYSVAMGGDWESKVAPLPPAKSTIFANQVFFRDTLNEYGIHVDVRKAMSETLNGSIGLEYKERRGGSWWTASGLTGNPLTMLVPAAIPPAVINPLTGQLVSVNNSVLPDMYMDRDRTKLRANLDWEATEKLSLQAVVEHTMDIYLRQPLATTALAAQVIPTVPGAKTIMGESMSVDATYLLTEDWRVNGFWTYSYNRWNVNKANLGDDTRNNTNTFGIRVSGKATSRLSVGLDILATRDNTRFNNMVSTAVVGAAPGNNVGFNPAIPGNFLPNISYATTKLNLSAKYEVDKVSDVQAVFAYQQFKTNDWQWGNNGVPFLYSDNTTVSQPTNQSLKFLGISYLLKF